MLKTILSKTPFLLQCGMFVYYIFMILYLTKASTYDQYLDKRDIQFRQAALVITYILTVITGVSLLVKIKFHYYLDSSSYNYGN